MRRIFFSLFPRLRSSFSFVLLKISMWHNLVYVYALNSQIFHKELASQSDRNLDWMMNFCIACNSATLYEMHNVFADRLLSLVHEVQPYRLDAKVEYIHNIHRNNTKKRPKKFPIVKHQTNEIANFSFQLRRTA